MNVSHVSLVMDKDGNLLVSKNKGRPTAAEAEEIKTKGTLRAKLLQLKKDMKYKDGTSILLALSIASDEMIRVVHMFPEVGFMDTTANTNKQNRDLFLLVVKDASGETFIGNVTIIPSQQRWVFSKIYHSFFVRLYGKACMSRLRLAVTDDDPSAHGPLDMMFVTDPCYNATHMLCVFHGLVMQFQENVYPLLPHKRGSQKKLLTKRGELYGTFSVYILIGVLILLSRMNNYNNFHATHTT